ncbi:DUF4258 domain-containing protein [Methylorubrum thiocyanatum]|uniref:DUF4258 domain-containing protein n=1 Tax=Methylorubrum thiocyanatum TaxID=47958 RepID=A0AA40VAW6_9HYPH|nr:DUF4258 domain-containing protein [Methylorubrum thiocyanatum]MBA8911822.1 hypothetical protein [Methylorubrum thiocyanatum]GJE79885.1 hypothetical protein CJNNKLLH_1215 [Methylorubrum thiocyanatum]
MKIVYGSHALDTLTERGIEREWVARRLAKPDRVEPDPVHPDRMRAFRTLPERDGRVLRVVYVPVPGGARVVTMFLDRGRRRKA